MNEINDSLNYINDSFGLHGEVELINLKDGKIIFRKHNMIVKGGRDYIRDLILSKNSSFLDNPTTEKDGYHFGKIKYGTNGNAVSLNDSAIAAVDGLEEDIKTDNAKYNIDSNRITISCSVNSNNISATIQELGIFLTNGDSEILFSRIVFDPVTVGPDSSFKLNYYIYF